MSGNLQLAPDPAIAPDEGSISVVLVDEHAALRRNIRLLLDGEADVTVVAESADLATAHGQIFQKHPQVLVLDLGMRGGSSIDTIRLVRDSAPGTEIVAMSMDPSPARAQHALDAGATAFVLKQRADTDLPGAISCAARGERYVSPQVAPRP